MKRVIVTGADGFVGCNIVDALLDAGYFVSAVDRNFENRAYSQFPAEKLQLVRSDCVKLPPIAADALIHAAFVTASPAARGETPEANLRANIEPLLSVLEYVEQQAINRAIFLSSDAVFRFTPATLVDESRPQQPHGVYAIAKTLLEQTVSTMRQEWGRDVVCARLGAIYGPFEFPRSSRPKLSLVGQMLHEALTSGVIRVLQPEERREWTYAPDIGRALIALLEADSLNHALYQLASGERLSNFHVARQIARLFDAVSLQIAAINESPEAPLSRLGWLDNSRVRQDTGFNDWTRMSADTLKRTLDSIRAGVAHA